MNTRKGLLKTKLFIPRAKEGLIQRPALLQQLEKGRRCKLTLLTAPAGFGKSVALSQWVTRTEMPVGWLSLDKGENNPYRFLAYLVLAIQSVCPQVGEEILGLLDLPEKPPTAYLLSLLINELLETRETGLVLDDYHSIDNPEVHGALAFLLQHLPGHVHLYLASRIVPEELSLARLRAQQELHEIKGSDLGFSREDTRTFFAAAGLNLLEESLQVLHDKTEGWGLSLQLVQLALQDAPDPAALIREFSGTHRYLMDYLLKDIFANLSPRLQDFLLQTSLVPALNASLCQALTEQAHCQELIEQVENQNLLLMPLDNRREWYRYHPLFAEWLQDRQQREKSAELPLLHRRAAYWYAAQESWTEAMGHILAAGDLEQAEKWLENIAEQKLRHGEIKDTLAWFEHLPEPQRLANPKLAVFYSYALIDADQPEQAEQWLVKIGNRYAGPDSPPTEFPVLACISNLQASLAHERDDADSMIAYGQAALQQSPDAHDSVRGDTYTLLGLAHFIRGNYAEAWQMFSLALVYQRQAGDLFTELVSQLNRARVLIAQGKLAQAERLLQQVEQEAQGNPLRKHPAMAILWLLLAEIYYYRNQLDLMQAHMDQALAMKTHWHYFLMVAFLQLSQGHNDRAESLLGEIKTMKAQHPNNYQMRLYALETYARLHLGQQEELAERIANLQSYLAGKSAEQTWMSTLILAFCLLADNQFEQALKQTESAIAVFQGVGNRTWELRFLLVQVVALLRQGKLAPARKKLIQALQMGQPEHYVGPFLNEWVNLRPHIEAILSQAVRGQTGLEPGYLKAIIKAYDAEPAKTYPLQLIKPKPAESPLSQRECEILKMLENGLSTPEISQQLVVSLNTAKTHIKNIYRKLEASSREQALAKAYELSLL